MSEILELQASTDSPLNAVPLYHAGGFLGTRHLICFMLFLLMAIAYALRVILSVAIVAMCSDCGQESARDDFPTYEWSDDKDTILSSFFWGYVVTQMPAGLLAQALGAKLLMIGSLGLCSAATLLTPLVAQWGWGAVCALRVLQGLAQGAVLPGSYTLLSKWTPPQERATLATFVFAGAQLGTIVALSGSGALADSSLGWPSVFYVFGGAGAVWVASWMVLGASTPAQHRWCSSEERDYIEASLGDANNNLKAPPTPWKKILTSVPVWALLAAHCAQNWGFWTLLTEMPSYMDAVLGFDLGSNGLLSALPYLVMWLLSFVFGPICAYILGHKILTITATRKVFQVIAHWGPAVALLGVGYVKEDQSALAVVLLTVAVGLNAGSYMGYQTNHIDLSPNFSGFIIGFTNCLAGIMSILAPLLVGFVVTDDTSQAQWRTVFFIASGIYFVGNLIFIVFGSGEEQPWNTPKDKRGDVENEKNLEANHNVKNLEANHNETQQEH